MEFNYQAKNQIGQVSTGVVDAPNESAAVSVLHDRGLTILSLEYIRNDIFAGDINEKLSRTTTRDIVVFTRQLSTLVSADMPLAEGLRTLAQQIEKPGFKKIIMDVAIRVESGTSLSGALAAYPKLFTSFYIKLAQAGEMTGKLEGSLLYLADYLESSQGINSKIRGALMYPAFVVSAMVLVGGIMGVYVLPQLLSVFKDAGVKDLPITTKALIVITDFINNYLYYILGAFVALIFFTIRFARSPKGKAFIDNAAIKAPAIGVVVRNLFLARIGESMSTLVKSGIPILDGLKITADLVGNSNYQKIMLEAEEQVRNGGKISEVLIQHKQEIPPLFASMVAIGERTGKLDYMLEHVSKFYKSESEQTINSITLLLEPVLVLVLGAGVAVLVASILLPIYSLVSGN